MIPKLLHRIFLDEPVPAPFDAFWERFRELHPAWSLVTWNATEDVLPLLRCRAEFEQAETHAGRSDILRYELLWTFGGVYVDTDVEPLRAFDDLLDGKAFAAWEDSRMICPTVMGAEPCDPAVSTILEALPRWFRRHRGRPPNVQTGPHLLTHLWRDRGDVRLLEPVTFYPVHWSEKRKLGGPYPPESYAVHHWAAGWLPAGPPQR